ncbi:hypothetical protein K456DRAFT_1327375 [Colletotrichum gloeosporioides 23]|nr:hypothetical protein K456DRAFT_1327375 [Colletotrichum gloeosporioides 23]
MSKHRSEFSNNILDASGNNNNINVHYGHVYQAQTSSAKWTDVSRWIAGPEEGLEQRRLQNSLQKKIQESETGRWFHEGESFERWRSQPSSLLWLHGKTGCGKSTLCSSAIKQLQSSCNPSSSKAVIYHFFTVTDRRSQSCDNLLRNLVLQLARHNNHTRDCAEQHYKLAGEGVQHAENDQLASIFKDLLKLVPLVYIIIDALDECAEQSKTCAFVQEICG